MNFMRSVEVAVLCTSASGPDMVFVIVECHQEQYDDGDHYEAAKQHARELDYEEPMMCFDQFDPASNWVEFNAKDVIDIRPNL